MSKEVTYFGAGCFWCSEAAYTRLKGVLAVQSGYAGGEVPDPSYEQVSTGTTGHAEVVKVEYDSQIVEFKDLLAVFFTIHDPTTLNRQGYDVGTQYRSIILCSSEDQLKQAKEYISGLTKSKTFSSPIVTEVERAGVFYPADSSHYRYYDLNRSAGYCQAIIDPKIAKLRKTFAHLLKEEN